MEANSIRIARVFSNGGDIHFRLPYFQREYAWEKGNWQTLWDDIEDLYDVYNDDNPPEHFMGSLVVVEDGMVNGTIPAFKLVDGQQRLTTISIILCVLADLIQNSDTELYMRIRKYITNPLERGELFFKLVPTSKHGDRKAYTGFITRNLDDTQNESLVSQSYQYFTDILQPMILKHTIDPEKLFKVITNALQVVFINLNSNEKPYQIFESLNAKSKPLSQADLVRNYIAMKLPVDRQQVVFENHWSKVEDLLQEQRFVGNSRLGELTAFLRHYLTYRSGSLCNEQKVYERFRNRVETELITPELFEDEILILKYFAVWYDRFLRPAHEPDNDIRRMFERLNILDFSTGYPFLFPNYQAYDEGKISKDQFIEALKAIENYMVRRYIAGEKTNYLNKVFPSLWKDINLDDYLPTVKSALVKQKYPADYRIQQSVYSTKLYDNSSSTRAKTKLIFESMDHYLSDLKHIDVIMVLAGEPSIEHIMPQSLSEGWKKDLGDNWYQIHEQYLHTLGNLTIVTSEWNEGLSNLRFKEKKPKLANHGLLINNLYFSQNLESWNDESIIVRADLLRQIIIKIWPLLGEVNTGRHYGTKPIALSFLGQVFQPSSWRDVAEHTTELVIKRCDKFLAIAEEFPSNLSINPFPHATRQLSNELYLNTNLSAASLKSYCKKIILRADLPYDDWHVEEA